MKVCNVGLSYLFLVFYLSFILFFLSRSSRPEVFCKKGLPNAKFKLKNLCQGLFLIKKVAQAAFDCKYKPFIHEMSFFTWENFIHEKFLTTLTKFLVIRSTKKRWFDRIIQAYPFNIISSHGFNILNYIFYQVSK